MSQSGFLQALEQFPKDSINDEICEFMQPYFDAEDYNQESAKRVCLIAYFDSLLIVAYLIILLVAFYAFYSD